ncbi:ribonuclease H1-like isoform X2 [Ischnura elegans]|uniref:ribonuclease H1-like isoform X2 n=1 Tax=Ischnura elegans TaxID=197161 RepID=UPI001ED86867|nr:ribonuclease H1-like isoform X2 [Ischnura elegans]XP_046403883.1 ribonuclease H1-like isoform X2 [Ischnura elegans]XP_046403884.1 ribonuclease H1-like isoform X2 [Ischnura elegans]
MMSGGKYYAVACGRNPGVYFTWEECQRETKGWPNAAYKKFGVEKQAWDFVKEHCPNMKLSAGSSPAKTKVVDVEPSTSGPCSKVSLSELEPSASGPSFKVGLLERLQRLEHQIKKSHENILIELNSIKEACLLPPAKSSMKIAFIDVKDAPAPPSISRTNLSAVESDANPAKRARLEIFGNSPDKFMVDNDGYVLVYTDGACSKNGRRGSQAGIGVWFGDGHNLNISEPVKGRITNNCAEIEAATAAIEAAHAAGVKKLKVYTDSNFLISCITQWIKKWKRNGWKTGDGQPVKNKEELLLLNEARNLLDVQFIHVKGHSGNYENDQADALARAGASRCPPKTED